MTTHLRMRWRFNTNANWFYDSALLRRRQRMAFNKRKKQRRATTGRR
jgi:hypothetical protein